MYTSRLTFYIYLMMMKEEARSQLFFFVYFLHYYLCLCIENRAAKTQCVCVQCVCVQPFTIKKKQHLPLFSKIVQKEIIIS